MHFVVPFLPKLVNNQDVPSFPSLAMIWKVVVPLKLWFYVVLVTLSVVVSRILIAFLIGGDIIIIFSPNNVSRLGGMNNF